MMESIVYDASGQLISGSFIDYAMPRASDFICLRLIDNPHPTSTNPLGIKGAGESGTVGALPAVMNAVADALRPYGIEHLDMPASPQRVWNAMRKDGAA
jgi:carbon-monoxide dehydrogenase large subunit